MLPVIKVFDIDYSFIIKNYLSPELWQKKWNLFVYGGFVFRLYLSSIYVSEEKIYFYVELEDTHNKMKYGSECFFANNKTRLMVCYSLKIDNVNFLKREIYSAMKECINQLEKRAITFSDAYLAIEKGKEEENERLTQIAEDFLDSEGVKNKDIRECYIDSFVDKNEQTNRYLGEYQNKMKYNLLTDLYLVLATTNNDKDLLSDMQKNTLNQADLDALIKQVNEYIANLETEDFKEEVSWNLEDI